MDTKALFPCGGGSNLILGTGTENQIFILRTPASNKLFPSNSEKLSLLCKTKSLPTTRGWWGGWWWWVG